MSQCGARIMRSFLYISFIAIAGCTTAAVDNSDQLDPYLGKADEAAKPHGTYTNATPHYGELTTLTLADDHTFTLSEIGACAGGGTCAPIVEHGTYLFTHSSTTDKRYIRLYGPDGTALDRYQWKLTSDGTLSLELDGDDHWFAMSVGSTCESAGGTCVPLVPDACAIGTVGDANTYSCGGGAGVQCCLPPAANGCAADSDCTGLLPQFCRTCSDGSDGCAHWSCLESSCQIATCN